MQKLGEEEEEQARRRKRVMAAPTGKYKEKTGLHVPFNRISRRTEDLLEPFSDASQKQQAVPLPSSRPSLSEATQGLSSTELFSPPRIMKVTNMAFSAIVVFVS